MGGIGSAVLPIAGAIGNAILPGAGTLGSIAVNGIASAIDSLGGDYKPINHGRAYDA